MIGVRVEVVCGHAKREPEGKSAVKVTRGGCEYVHEMAALLMPVVRAETTMLAIFVPSPTLTPP